MSAKIPFFILFALIFTPTASAFSDEPINVSDEELKKILEEDYPDEIQVSFWELPLWIKVHYIATVVLSFLAAWKLLPVVITKIKSALENAKRRRIFKIIMKNPGVSLTELEEITGENRSTLRYHLRKLEEEKWIRTVKIGNSRHVFLNTPDFNPTTVVKGRKKEIIELLKEHGCLTSKQIAERLNLSVKTVHHHLNEMKKIGIVCRDDDGKYGLVTDPGRRTQLK